MSEWINVNERMPEENNADNRDGIVLVFDENWNKRCEEHGYGNYGYALAKVMHGKWFVIDDYVDIIHPTHWKPLPVPPKDK